MIEQKLFFTRNGEYTIWEKIDSLKLVELSSILETIQEDDICAIQAESSEMKGKIYTIYESDVAKKNFIYNEIDKYFDGSKFNKNDFNANLYKVKSSFLNIELAYTELLKLKDEDASYGIENMKSKVFLLKDDNIIDVRIQSVKINDYKNNLNEQLINTEVRYYFNLGVLVITDYGDYTHNKTIKDNFLKNIYSLLGDTYGNRESYKLSDITLRLLLTKSRKHASKFKFYVEDCGSVDFNIIEDISDNPLQNPELRAFYDTHKIKVIKICMSSDLDKYITIDGEKGKLTSRSKNIEVKDIDSFINLLNEVMKYDYLNYNYKDSVKDLVLRKLSGHTAGKMDVIRGIYENIKNEIVEYLQDKNERERVQFTENTFFYCLLKESIVITPKSPKYTLDKGVILKLSKWLDIDKSRIEIIFNDVVEIAIQSNGEDLLELFDGYINNVGELNVGQI